MLLSRVSDYLARRGRATVGDIALGVGADPGALRGMLRLLERKGCVHRVATDRRCGACSARCAMSVLDEYEWRGPAGA